jgi:hypothetical protein
VLDETRRSVIAGLVKERLDELTERSKQGCSVCGKSDIIFDTVAKDGSNESATFENIKAGTRKSVIICSDCGHVEEQIKMNVH